VYADVEVPQIVFMGDCADAGDTEPRSDRPQYHVGVQTYGSAISRSVSLMMRFGSAILSIQIYAAPPGQTKLALLKFDPVRRRLLEHPAGFLCRHERK
jgi:hypothetical protein